MQTGYQYELHIHDQGCWKTRGRFSSETEAREELMLALNEGLNRKWRIKDVWNDKTLTTRQG